MCWIKNFIKKIHDYFFPIIGEKENLFICVFLRHDTDFVFLAPNKELKTPKTLSPILLPIGDMLPVESTMQEVQDLLFKEFAIEPERITLSYQYQSLAPLESKTFFFATVEITSQDIQELIGFPDKAFIVVNLPYIALHEESNLFFKYLITSVENS